jgi:hypothetical protein
MTLLPWGQHLPCGSLWGHLRCKVSPSGFTHAFCLGDRAASYMWTSPLRTPKTQPLSTGLNPPHWGAVDPQCPSLLHDKDQGHEDTSALCFWDQSATWSIIPAEEKDGVPSHGGAHICHPPSPLLQSTPGGRCGQGPVPQFTDWEVKAKLGARRAPISIRENPRPSIQHSRAKSGSKTHVPARVPCPAHTETIP